MTWVAVAVVGSTLVGGMMSSNAQQDAANTAANAQTQAAQGGIAEQRRQFDAVRQLLNPFVQAATGSPGGGSPLSGGGAPAMETADQIRARLAPQFTSTPTGASTAGGFAYGSGGPQYVIGANGQLVGMDGQPPPTSLDQSGLEAAVQAELARQQAQGGAGGPGAAGSRGSLGAQLDLSGANGPQAQQAAIDALQKTPAFTSQLRLGENRILQNASATGGLRGGNTQAALAYFAPSLLASTINDQYARLGGLTSLGENAAVMTGNAGMQTGNNVTQLLQGAGAAQAGSALAAGRAQASMWGNFGGAIGQYAGMGGFNGIGAPTPDAVQGQFAQTPAGAAGFGTGAAYGNQDYGLFL